jgi:hypothetical protein
MESASDAAEAGETGEVGAAEAAEPTRTGALPAAGTTSAAGTTGSASTTAAAGPKSSLAPPRPGGGQPVIPDLREHLPSIVWGAALPIAAFFVVRHHVSSDTQALIIAGSFSVAWIVVQFIRQRRIDLVGLIVLIGFAIGVSSSVIFNGNDYMLKVRDAFFTALFGAACVITVFTHERPTLFYVSRYLSAGNDPEKVTAYNQLLEAPIGRRTFKVLSLVWGVGLMAEAGFRMVLADVLHTSTFIAISPIITVTIIGSLFAFTVAYVKRAQLESAALVRAVEAVDVAPGTAQARAAETADVASDVHAYPQIPLP